MLNLVLGTTSDPSGSTSLSSATVLPNAFGYCSARQSMRTLPEVRPDYIWFQILSLLQRGAEGVSWALPDLQWLCIVTGHKHRHV